MHIDILKWVGSRKFQNTARHTIRHDHLNKLCLDDNSSQHKDGDR
jgi:hypothetical protein